MKKLQGVRIAVTGDFGSGRSHEDMQRWTMNNGGTFSKEVDKAVTHLVSTFEDFEAKCCKGLRLPLVVSSLGGQLTGGCVAVKQALKLGSIKIVSYDWLEDSLQGKSPKREKRYLLSQLRSHGKKKSMQRKAVAGGMSIALPCSVCHGRPRSQKEQRWKDSCGDAPSRRTIS